MTRLLPVGAAVMLGAWVSSAPALVGVEFNSIEIADSGSYFVYHYQLVNPPGSTWGLVDAEMDVSATSGTPDLLAATGNFRDRSSLGAPEAWAEVGPIVPTGWTGYFWSNGELIWSLPFSAWLSEDSVAPGDTITGFGIRSSYLPGLRVMKFRPTPESCCTTTLTGDSTGQDFGGLPHSYEVTGWSVGPRYLPDEVDLALLQSQLAAVCSTPLWIDDTGLCGRLGDTLDAAAASAATGNYDVARSSVGRFHQELGDAREPQGPVQSNAYWLLKWNAEHVMAWLSAHVNRK